MTYLLCGLEMAKKGWMYLQSVSNNVEKYEPINIVFVMLYPGVISDSSWKY